MPLFKKKLKDTKLGHFLAEKAPDILNKVGDLLPDKGGLGIVKHLISKDEKLTPEDKEYAQMLLDHEIKLEQEISERWKSDMSSDSILSKNVRPIILLYSWFLFTVVVVLGACGIELPEGYPAMLEALLISVNMAYFGSRGIEKYHEFKMKRGK